MMSTACRILIWPGTRWSMTAHWHGGSASQSRSTCTWFSWRTSLSCCRRWTTAWCCAVRAPLWSQARRTPSSHTVPSSNSPIYSPGMLLLVGLSVGQSGPVSRSIFTWFCALYAWLEVGESPTINLNVFKICQLSVKLGLELESWVSLWVHSNINDESIQLVSVFASKCGIFMTASEFRFW